MENPGLHKKFEMPKVPKLVMLMLLAFGFFTLSTSFLLRESYPEYAALGVLVGVTCVVATDFIIAAVLLPPQLDPIVWVFVALIITVLAILCYIDSQEGHTEESA
ncbi:hypothetical protein Nepgr_017086 [Nepenthes gracilis]|uniref:Uncharacterized protein n=1 Tax=Nepenthes gracilis TaxID=150966 RepID=A0AAD3SNS6_NEPGR|nr:hypothetical protein Nepgr_017086 [Nepenthes gracilis]